MTRLRALYFASVSAYTFGLSYLWSGMNSIILPAIMLDFVPYTLKGTYLAVMTFLGAVIAMLIQPLSGAFSDQTGSSWGRRRPWMIAGALGTFASLIFLGAAQSYLVLLLAYLCLQITSNIAHGPAQGLIPDLVPRRRHGAAAGVKNLLDISGFVLGALIAGLLIDRDMAASALAITIIFMAASLLFFLLRIRERPSLAIPKEPLSSRIMNIVRKAYRLDHRRYPDYTWLLVGRFLVLCGVYTMQGFGQFFVRDVLAPENPGRVTARLLVFVGVGTAALVYPAGLLSDRFGRKTWNVISSLVCGLGVFLLLGVNSFWQLLAVGALVGAGMGSFLSVNWALATDLVPSEEAGKYLGLSNLATAGAGATSRLGGPLLDLFNYLQPGMGYNVLFFLAGCVITLGSFILYKKVREPVLK